MRRTAAFCVFAVVAAIGCLTVAVAQTSKLKLGDPPAVAAPFTPAKEIAAKELPAKLAANVDLVAVLSQRVTIAALNDPKATLEDVLKQWSRQFDITFDLNIRAFINEGIKDPEQVLMAEKALPGSNNMRLETALRRMLARIPCTSGATFLVRRDSIEITTNALASREIWGADFDGPFLPLVNLRTEKMPLNEVLTQLADQSGLSIMVAGAAEKAATPITVRFINVPVDTAVRLLADQADLGVVHRDNVLMVTTEDKATSVNARFLIENPEQGLRFRRGGEQGVKPNAQ